MKEVKILNNLCDAMSYAAASETFRIRKGILYEYGTNAREVYCIFLRGTNQSMDPSDILSLPTCVKSSIGYKNNYIETVKKAVLDEVPLGSYIMLIGHSLGGMVAQQFIADKEMLKSYKLLNALTIGSPYVIGLSHGCPLHRVADRADVISMLSLPLLSNMLIGHIRTESGGYYFNVLGAHCDSYRHSSVWEDYDVFGVPNGKRTYEFEEEIIQPETEKETVAAR